MIAPKNILVIRLSSLGDVLLATPAVRALAKSFPGAHIDWLVEAAYLPVLAGSPHARPVAYHKRGEHAGMSGLLRLRRTLAAHSYELVVDLQDKPKTWLLRGLAPRCIALKKRTRLGALLALIGREAPLTRAHAVDLCLAALAPNGIAPDGRALELKLTPAMMAQAAPLVPPVPVAGIAPGARWPSKRWPAGKFALLARALKSRGYSILLLGGGGDAADLAAVRALLGFEAPDTTTLDVGGLAAAVARCSVVIAGDSGPSHVAAALGVPIVTLFGPTSPERWRPLSEHAEVVRVPLACSPCSNHGDPACPLGHHDCMQQLEVEDVLAAVKRLTGG